MGLDIVELVVAVEKKFEVTFENSELKHARTVGALHKLLLKELSKSEPGVALTHDQDTWNGLCEVLEQEFSIPRNKIRADASFVDDLRLD